MEKTFDALEWLAAMTSHVPNKGEQMVGYYGYYSSESQNLSFGSFYAHPDYPMDSYLS